MFLRNPNTTTTTTTTVTTIRVPAEKSNNKNTDKPIQQHPLTTAPAGVETTALNHRECTTVETTSSQTATTTAGRGDSPPKLMATYSAIRTLKEIPT